MTDEEILKIAYDPKTSPVPEDTVFCGDKALREKIQKEETDKAFIRFARAILANRKLDGLDNEEIQRILPWLNFNPKLLRVVIAVEAALAKKNNLYYREWQEP